MILIFLLFFNTPSNRCIFCLQDQSCPVPRTARYMKIKSGTTETKSKYDINGTGPIVGAAWPSIVGTIGRNFPKICY